jgi:hypothetical protein
MPSYRINADVRASVTFVVDAADEDEAYRMGLSEAAEYVVTSYDVIDADVYELDGDEVA